MVAVITGENLGLSNSSLSELGNNGPGGSANLGRSREQVYINSATGNLVIRGRDEFLTSTGIDQALIRTYNSQGLLNDDNHDNWRLNIHKQLTNLPGNPNTPQAGDSITRIDGDGAESTYIYIPTNVTPSDPQFGSFYEYAGMFVNTDGDGAYDTLSYANNTWTWTDGTTGVTEAYTDIGGGDWRMTGRIDQDGNTLSYEYTQVSSGQLQLTRITLEDSQQNTSQTIDLTYNGNNLESVTTHSFDTDGNPIQQTRVRYGYDSENRLAQVIVDLTPDIDGVGAGDLDGDGIYESVNQQTYVTTYTYEGTSRRISSIQQGDGTTISFTYDAQGRIQTYRDGLNQETRIDYNTLVNDVPNTVSLTGEGVSVITSVEQTTTVASDLVPANATTTAEQTTLDYPLDNTQLVSSVSQSVFHTLNDTLLSQTDTAPVAVPYTLDTTQLTVSTAPSQPAGWTATQLLEMGTGTVTESRVAFDSAGNGFAIWPQDYNLYVSRYENGSWGAPELLETLSNSANYPELSVSDNGHAVVVWSQYSAAGNYVFANRYVPGSGWQGAETIDGTDYRFSADMIASVNNAGDVSVVWTASIADGTSNTHVKVNRYEAANGGWQGVELIPELGSGYSSMPQVSLDEAGNTTLLWLQYGNGTSVRDVFTNRYENGGWVGTSVLHDATSSSDAAYYPQVAFDAQGNGLAVWSEGYDLFGKRFENGAWSTTKDTLAPIAGSPSNVSLRMNSAGDGVMVWSEGSSVYANRYDAANGGWQGHELVESTSEIAVSPSVAISETGVIQVAWQQRNGTTYVYNTHTNRYDPANGGWQGVEAVAELTSSNGVSTQVAIDGAGNATIVWDKFEDGTSIRSLYTARYDLGVDNTPYYVVGQNDTWGSIATLLYGSGDVADELVRSLYGDTATIANTPLIPGDELRGFVSNLSSNDALRYVVQSNNETWESID